PCRGRGQRRQRLCTGPWCRTRCWRYRRTNSADEDPGGRADAPSPRLPGSVNQARTDTTMAGPKSTRPHEEYTHRLEDRRRSRAELAWRERLLGNSRVLVFVVGLLLAYPTFRLALFSAWWLLAPLAVFSFLLVRHERVTRALLRSGRAVAFYERGLARLE